jgi:hypothetical protein
LFPQDSSLRMKTFPLLPFSDGSDCHASVIKQRLCHTPDRHPPARPNYMKSA